MKTIHYNSASIKKLQPLEVATYLKSTGWTQQHCVENTWANWVKDDIYEIFLPLNQNFRDFSLRMSEVLRQLELAEKRSQIMIFNDLLTTNSDIIRVRLIDPELEDGTITIDEHERIIQNVRNMMKYAACATINPEKANDYLKGIRIGQSERGSYILTIHSRIPPRLQSDKDDPFPRKIVEQLALALDELRLATQNNLESFANAIKEKTISADLCKAVMGLAGLDNQRSMEISFSWACGLPLTEERPALVAFQAHEIFFIAEAERLSRKISLPDIGPPLSRDKLKINMLA
ncbi:MAG: hypothetical protein HQL93_09435 [Magnetococcales bacterium]|nr:hypothetical protein [Magnetococcales bacterium]